MQSCGHDRNTHIHTFRDRQLQHWGKHIMQFLRMLLMCNCRVNNMFVLESLWLFRRWLMSWTIWKYRKSTLWKWVASLFCEKFYLCACTVDGKIHSRESKRDAGRYCHGILQSCQGTAEGRRSPQARARICDDTSSWHRCALPLALLVGWCDALPSMYVSFQMYDAAKLTLCVDLSICTTKSLFVWVA